MAVIGLQLSLIGCRSDLIKAAFEDNQGLNAQTIAAELKEALQQGSLQGVNALDGLYLVIAVEEKRIRQDPCPARLSC